MKAIQIIEFGGPDVMRYVDLDDPIAQDGEEVLNVTAIGVNYADTHQTENSYLSKQKLPLIPGMEVVGKTHSGRRVLGMAMGGGYAEKVLVRTDSLVDIPDGISDGQALAMMVQGTTAWHILKTLGHLSAGESVVIHAAVGGVGSLAIQLAKMWGAYVIAVTSSDEKKKLAKDLGADVVVDARAEDMKAALMAANNGKKVDIVLEMVGGKTFDQSLEAVAPFGRMITYGMASRTPPAMLNPATLIGTSKTISGFWLAHCFGRKDLLQDVLVELFALILVGKLKPVIGGTYPLSHAIDVHKMMLARASIGKIVLDPSH